MSACFVSVAVCTVVWVFYHVLPSPKNGSADAGDKKLGFHTRNTMEGKMEAVKRAQKAGAWPPSHANHA